MSISGGARTGYIEIKHGTPDFDSQGLQELTMCRLASASFYARYVIFHEHRGMQRTLIAHPLKVMQRTSWDIEAEAWCVGFDMRWLVNEVRKAHRL